MERLRRIGSCAASYASSRPHHLVAWGITAAAGVVVGYSAALHSRVAVGLLYTAALAVYLTVNPTPARIAALAALAGIHAGALASTASSKLVLPLIIVERGPIGSSVYPDIVQAALAYEALKAASACLKQFKPQPEEGSQAVPR